MKTILIFEPYLQKGHRFVNNQLVSILSQNFRLLIPNPHNYYEVKSSNITYIKIPELSREGHGKYMTRLICFLNFFFIRVSIFFRNYDHILVMAYHTPHFKFQYKLMPHKTITVFDHSNIDRLIFKHERADYFSFCNKVGHMVFASYLKDYLRSLGVDENKIFVITHPISQIETKDEAPPKASEYKHILCPGLSNDEQIIKEIVEYESRTHLLEKNKIILTLRCDLRGIQLPKSINIMGGYLSTREYDNLYKNNSGILVTYPSNYEYRFSGVILNSLCAHKVVFGNNLKIVQFFSSYYPNNCRLFNSIEDLFSQIISDFDYDENEFERFKENHSDESVLKSFNFLFD